MYSLSTKEGVVTLTLPLSTKTFRNFRDVGILIYCIDFFLLLGKSSVFTIFIPSSFTSCYITDFYCFRFFLFCGLQIFTKSLLTFWVVKITFTTLNFINYIVIAENNIFWHLFSMFLIIVNFCLSNAVGLLHGVVGVSGSWEPIFHHITYTNCLIFMT